MKTKSKKVKLFAFVHDGTCDGDNTFYFPSYPIPYEQGMTLDQLKEGHLKAHADQMRSFGQAEKEIEAELGVLKEEEISEIKGAVVVEEAAVKAMNAIWNSDPGNDSAVYSCNRAAKNVAWSMAKHVIGKGME